MFIMHVLREFQKAILWLTLALLAAAGFPVSAAQQRLAGPVQAIVERVVDGDTLAVRAQIWLGQEVRVLVRLGGADTPELHGACRRERELALHAQRFARDFAGMRVFLTEIDQDKYGGRVLALVSNAQGADLAQALIKAGLARPYDGGARGDWCAAALSQSRSPP